jgi:hypothetical protein
MKAWLLAYRLRAVSTAKVIFLCPNFVIVRLVAGKVFAILRNGKVPVVRHIHFLGYNPARPLVIVAVVGYFAF